MEHVTQGIIAYYSLKQWTFITMFEFINTFLEALRNNASVVTLLGAMLAAYVAYNIHEDKLRNDNVKERAASERGQKLASVLVSARLAVFIKGCLWVAADEGYDEYGQPAGGGMGGFVDVLMPTTEEPDWEPNSIDAEWKYLDPNLVDQLFKLSLLVDEARSNISSAKMDSDPPEYTEYFFKRRMQYIDLGLRAIGLRSQLITTAGLADKGMPQLYMDAAEKLSSMKLKLLEAERLREKRIRDRNYTRDLLDATKDISQAVLTGDEEASKSAWAKMDALEVRAREEEEADKSK